MHLEYDLVSKEQFDLLDLLLFLTEYTCRYRNLTKMKVNFDNIQDFALIIVKL